MCLSSVVLAPGVTPERGDFALIANRAQLSLSEEKFDWKHSFSIPKDSAAGTFAMARTGGHALQEGSESLFYDHDRPAGGRFPRPGGSKGHVGKSVTRARTVPGNRSRARARHMEL